MAESNVNGPFQWQNWQCACAVSRDRMVGVIQNHIFGISDPNLPIHCINFMCDGQTDTDGQIPGDS